MKTIKIFTGIFSIFLYTNCFSQGQWVQQNSGTNAMLTSVYFVSKDTGFVASESGYLFKTTNGGTTWNQAGIGAVRGLYFLDSQNGFASGGNCITKTQNGGTSWTAGYVNTAFYEIWCLHFPDNTHGYAAGQTQNVTGLLAKTSDGGTTWDTIFSSSVSFNSVFFTDSVNGYIGANAGRIYKTTDGGNTWTPIIADAINFAAFYSIHFPTPDTGYAVTDYGMIYKTIDAGLTWNYLPSSNMNILYSVFFYNASTGYMVGGNGFSSCTLMETYNGGSTWVQNVSNSQTLMSVYFPEPSTGYAVGTNGTILKYTTSTGLSEDIANHDVLNIYPNPASDYITVEPSDLDLNKNYSITISNIQGQQLFQQSLDNSKITLDISGISKGIYFLKINSADGFAVKKFVKE
jgi:photosystem II stability/assembly factor-like uncharacterized protein